MATKESKNNKKKNYIQMDFERILFPLTLIQYIIFSPKYYLFHNYIRPNSIFTNLLIFSVTVIITLCFLYYSFKFLISKRALLNDFLIFLYYFEHLTYGLGYLLNVVFLIVQSRVNVKLIIRVEMIFNNLTINNRRIRTILIGNWIFCFLILLFYCMNVYVQIIHGFTTYLSVVLSIFVLMPWDFNIVYAARIIYLLRKQTESWIRLLKDTLNVKIFRKNDSLGSYRWQSILKAYLSIIDAYSACEKITEIPIIYHVILTFVQFISNVQTLIQFKGVNGILILCVMWTVKHAMLLALLSLECEQFHTCLKNSQVACLTTAYQNVPVPGRQVCKRLRKESQKPIQPITAKGLFQVNAALPLHLFSIIATYTVVLLQFNFL